MRATLVFALCLLAFCKASVGDYPGFLRFWFGKEDANGDGLISAGEFTDWKLQFKDCHGLQEVLIYKNTLLNYASISLKILLISHRGL